MYNLDNEVFRKPIAFSCGLETQANRQLLSNCQTNELQSLVDDLKTKYNKIYLDFLNLSIKKLILSSDYLKGFYNYEIINTAYVCNLFPTKEQEVLINKTFGCKRFIYNKMLSDS